MGSTRRGGTGLRRVSDRAGILTGAGAALILLVLLASTAGSPIARTPTRDIEGATTLRTSPRTGGVPTLPSDTRAPVSETVTTPTWFFWMMYGALLAILVLLVVLMTRWLRSTLRGRRRDGLPPPAPSVPPAAADSLLEDVDLHVRALEEGEPQEAIIAMWVAVERSVARAGVERLPAETSGELTLRVLDQLAVESEPVEALARLYREARFSTHPITAAQRDAASVALRDLHEALRRSRHDSSGGA